MELVSVGGQRGYGSVCCSSTRMIASSSSSSSLSVSNTFRNPLLSSSLFCKPFLEQEKQKKNSITARIDWQKDKFLDDVIQRQKKLKFVMKIKDLLVKEPGMCMSLRELGKCRKKLGLGQSRRLVVLLKQYPSVFDLFEEGASNLFFRLSPAAEGLFLEEQKLKAEMESLLVSKIRKLLMMSFDKTLLIYKISHLKRDLGLPDDFKVNLVEKYPQYFKVVELQSGPALELTSWDPELAISAWEKNLEMGLPNLEIRSSQENEMRRKHAKNCFLKRKDMQKIRRFHEMSYFSPYTEFAHLDPSSTEAERHSCAVVHEILSMTLQKRLNIDFLTHFRRDYKFSQQLHGMLVRHPELFYVSMKGDRNSVFLRAAYRGSELIQKEPLFLLKEKLRKLASQDERASNDSKDEDDDEEEADFDDNDDIYDDVDLSVDEEAKDGGNDAGDVTEEQAVNFKERMRPRPLGILQKEQEMAALVGSTERW